MNTHTHWATSVLGLSLLIVTSLANSSTIPVVDAGADQTIYLSQSANLHGTATGDPGLWQWDVVSAPGGSNWNLFDADTPDAIFSTNTLGNYVVTAEAYNYFGWSDPDALVISVIENLDPVAIASASPTSGVSPLTVNFDGSESYDPLGDTLLYDWDFGDLRGATGAIATHTYDSPGTYTARLYIADDFGKVDFDTITITVSAIPIPPAVWLFASGLVGLIGVARKKAA